nr:Gamma-aminobutyric acid receptor subunit beta [Biomphalaria glabrata]
MFPCSLVMRAPVQIQGKDTVPQAQNRRASFPIKESSIKKCVPCLRACAPLKIGIEIILASFDSISEVDMDYTITMYLNQYWQDERLQFIYNDSLDLGENRSVDTMTLTGAFAEKIWVPDTFLANDKNSFLHDITEKNKMVRLYGNGSLVYGMRFTTTLACMMDLHNYPLDHQACTVEIESCE